MKTTLYVFDSLKIRCTSNKGDNYTKNDVN